MLMNSSGQVFGRFNLIDFSALLLALLATLGILLVQSGLYRTSGQVIKGEGDIVYTVYVRNLKSLSPDLFVPGKKLSITIRNQPRGAVQILQAQNTPKRTSFMLPNGQLKTLADPADPYGYDSLVTLKDHALFTEDGYVTEGIKVKIGLPIEVEGRNYRVPGVIVDVREANEKSALTLPSPVSSVVTPVDKHHADTVQ